MAKKIRHIREKAQYEWLFVINNNNNTYELILVMSEFQVEMGAKTAKEESTSKGLRRRPSYEGSHATAWLEGLPGYSGPQGIQDATKIEKVTKQI